MEKMDNYMETGFLQELIWIMECRTTMLVIALAAV